MLNENRVCANADAPASKINAISLDFTMCPSPRRVDARRLPDCNSNHCNDYALERFGVTGGGAPRRWLSAETFFNVRGCGRKRTSHFWRRDPPSYLPVHPIGYAVIECLPRVHCISSMVRLKTFQNHFARIRRP